MTRSARYVSLIGLAIPVIVMSAMTSAAILRGGEYVGLLWGLGFAGGCFGVALLVLRGLSADASSEAASPSSKVFTKHESRNTNHGF